MTANYSALLADPLATKAWLCTLWPYDPSHVGPSLVGDGVAGYGAATVAAPAGSMSWGCWVKPQRSATVAKYICGFGGQGAAAGQRFLRLNSSGTNLIEAVVSNDAGTQFLATYAGGIVSAAAGAWTFAFAVLDLGNTPASLALYTLTMAPPIERMSGYLAVQRKTVPVTGTFNSPGNACSVLRDPVGANQYLDGEVSDFQVWSVAKALSRDGGVAVSSLQPWRWAHGIPAIKSGWAAAAGADTAGLAEYWELDDGAPATTAASSPVIGGAALTLTGVAWNPYGADWSAILPYYSSTHGFNSQPSDNPPNMEYAARITAPPMVKRSMYSGNNIGGYSTPDLGQLEFGNGDAGLDVMRPLAFDARRALLQLGGTLGKGTVLALSDYGTVLDGVGAGDILCDPQLATLHLRSKDFTFAKPIQNFPANTYSPPCVEVEVVGDRIVFPTFPAQTGSLTVEGWFYVVDLVTGQDLVHMNDGTHGFAVNINVGGNGTVRFATSDVSNGALVTAANTVVLGWNHIECVYDHGAQTKTISVNAVPVATVGSLTGALVAPSVALGALATAAGASGCLVGTRMSSLRIWSVARTQAQIQDTMRKRLAGNETGLLGSWGCREGQLAYVYDATANGYTGILFGQTGWDVADWADPNIAGAALPLCYGEVAEAPALLVDPASLIYQVHDGSVQLIKGVADKGAWLRPPFSYTGTDVSFDGPSGKITAAGADFSVFAPGIVGALSSAAPPVIPGASTPNMTITISGSSAGGNNATFQVLSVTQDIHGTSTVITVSGPLTTSAAGPSVTIVTAAGTAQWTADAARGYFTLLQNPAGTISAWVRGDNGGPAGYVKTAGQVIRRIVVRHGLLLDPADLDTAAFTAMDAANGATVGIAVQDTASSTPDPFTGSLLGAGRVLKDVCDEVANSAGALYGFERIGNLFQVAQFVGVPPGAAAVTLDYTSIETKPQWTTELQNLPIYRVAVGYAQNYNYNNSSANNLSGVALSNPARLAFCLRQYRYALAQDAQVLTTYSQARTLIVLANYTFYADALAEAERLLALLKVRSDLYKIGGHTLPYAVDVNQKAAVSYSLPGGAGPRLGTPRNFVILSFDEQQQLGSVGLGIWGQG